MEQSILKSTKKVLMVAVDDDAFDLDVITHINSAFSTLNDMGVGPVDGFMIEDDTATWEDFLPTDVSDTTSRPQQNQVKQFIWLKTRMMFDPPNSSYLQTAMEKQLDEMTYRISVRRENAEWVDPDPPTNGDTTVPEQVYDIDGGGAA